MNVARLQFWFGGSLARNTGYTGEQILALARSQLHSQRVAGLVLLTDVLSTARATLAPGVEDLEGLLDLKDPEDLDGAPEPRRTWRQVWHQVWHHCLDEVVVYQTEQDLVDLLRSVGS